MLTSLALATFGLSSPEISAGLLLVGGGETPPAIAQKFFELIGGPEQPILVVPLMREEAAKGGESSAEFLRENGAKNVSVLTETTFSASGKRQLRRRVLNCKGIWLPGGDQGLFMERIGAEFGKSLFQEAVRARISFYGTSAGAMLMSDPMINGWLDDTRPRMSPGLGLVPFLVDTHFRERKREGRLQYALDHWGNHTQGLGLSEGEWIVVRNGRVVEQSGKPEWFTRK